MSGAIDPSSFEKNEGLTNTYGICYNEYVGWRYGPVRLAIAHDEAVDSAATGHAKSRRRLHLPQSAAHTPWPPIPGGDMGDRAGGLGLRSF